MTGYKIIGSGMVAASSAAVIAIQEALPATAWEAGPWVAFMSSLAYAVVHLWRALRRSDEARELAAREMLARQQELSESHAESLSRLSKAIEGLGRKPPRE